MTVDDILVVLIAAGLFVVLVSRRLTSRDAWRATVTPLASIIGSGFLVAGPVLAHVAGRMAIVAMVALCAIAYVFGSAIRTNIRLIEPALADRTAGRAVLAIEWLSDMALTFAYFISVAYYLNLLGAFALRIFNVVDPPVARAVTTAVMVVTGAVGFARGLRGLEAMEILAVGIKLAIIGGAIAGLAWYNGAELAAGTFAWPEIERDHGWNGFAVLLGLVIMVQGFETSRYLGSDYPAELRIRTMRLAQALSTAIYIVFIGLVTLLFAESLPKQGGESAIIDLISPVAFVIGPLLIVAALASQFSAAVADMSGAGGLLSEVSRDRIRSGWGYLMVAGFGVALTWSANIFQIIVYASKAFAFYYGLQCLSALAVTFRRDRSRLRYPRMALYGLAFCLAFAIVLFGRSVEA